MNDQNNTQISEEDSGPTAIRLDPIVIEKISVDLERRLERTRLAYFKSQGKAEDEVHFAEAFAIEIASSMQLLARVLMHYPESARQNAEIFRTQLVNELDRLFEELCQTRH